MSTVPSGTKKLVSESENQNVLHHLLSQIVVDSEDVLLFPVRL